MPSLPVGALGLLVSQFILSDYFQPVAEKHAYGKVGGLLMTMEVKEMGKGANRIGDMGRKGDVVVICIRRNGSSTSTTRATRCM